MSKTKPAKIHLAALATAVAAITLVALGVITPEPSAALAQSPGGRIAFVSNRDGNLEIYTMNADGSDVVRLTKNDNWDSVPSWSPDGQRIAFASDRDGDSEIYTMNADGSGVVRLTDNGAGGPLSWSPDGGRIAFVSDRDGDLEIYTMNADGSGVVRLTDNDPYDRSPSWSPDGQRIAFDSSRDGDLEIYTMNADGSDVTGLTTNDNVAGGGTSSYHPSWSPDGQRIAFVSGNVVNENHIYTMNSDGSGVMRLTNDHVIAISPKLAWSPDGQRIAFDSNRDGDYEIYMINADGSDVVRLTNNDANDWLPAWGPAPAEPPTPTPTNTPEPPTPIPEDTPTPIPADTPTPIPPPTIAPLSTITPIPPTIAPPPTVAPASDGPIINCAAGQPCVDIQGERTEVTVGDEVRIAFSTINSLAQPPMTVSMTLQAPSGWTIVGEGISDACTSQCSAVYQIGSGKQRAVTFTSRANEAGQFIFQGRLEWYFGNDRERIYSENKDIRVTVTEPPTPTPTPTVVPTPTRPATIIEVPEPPCGALILYGITRLPCETARNIEYGLIAGIILAIAGWVGKKVGWF